MGRRTFSREFKISAVGLVQQQGYTVPQAAKSLGIDPGSLRGWLKQFPADAAAAPDSDLASENRTGEEASGEVQRDGNEHRRPEPATEAELVV